MQEGCNALSQTSGMQQTEEEMHSNTKSFYIQTQIPENTKVSQQILYRNKIVKST